MLKNYNIIEGQEGFVTKGISECQIPKKVTNTAVLKKSDKRQTFSNFPCTAKLKISTNNCRFVNPTSKDKVSGLSSQRTRNKFILMRGMIHSYVQKIANVSPTSQKWNHNVEVVSKIASWLWKQNTGVFQSYYEALAFFEDNRLTNSTIATVSSRKILDAVGRRCIPSTYSYETLTNGADTTAMESKKTYKAFCGRFSLKEATGRVRKKKPIQTFALRSRNIEDVFLL
ncbi:LAFA_0G00188g1_1 [Lachancea sp. 'fantastica']|nr:LAFA_0G00188g1_1 [Lachancea sp. 'fantastica']